MGWIQVWRFVVGEMVEVSQRLDLPVVSNVFSCVWTIYLLENVKSRFTHLKIMSMWACGSHMKLEFGVEEERYLGWLMMLGCYFGNSITNVQINKQHICPCVYPVIDSNTLPQYYSASGLFLIGERGRDHDDHLASMPKTPCQIYFPRPNSLFIYHNFSWYNGIMGVRISQTYYHHMPLRGGFKPCNGLIEDYSCSELKTVSSNSIWSLEECKTHRAGWAMLVQRETMGFAWYLEKRVNFTNSSCWYTIFMMWKTVVDCSWIKSTGSPKIMK